LTVAETTIPMIDIEREREALESALRGRIQGEVRFDQYNRMLYSTDASNYMIEPLGVVLPRTVDDIQAALDIAREFQVPVLPRGGGSSLAGQTVGRALVIDTSRYVNEVLEIDSENNRVRVQPGMVIQRLNAK